VQRGAAVPVPQAVPDIETGRAIAAPPGQAA
jgi:hypothetical protein